MRAVTSTALPQQTAAEHVRSVLARAVSLSLTTDRQTYDLIGMHTVDAHGGITLHPPADSPLTAELAAAPHGTLTAVLDLTDIAPTPLRDRVRSRVTLAGLLTPATPGTPPASGDTSELRLTLAAVTLRTGTGTHDVDLDAYTRAAPDPLAVEEAALLSHLADAHGDLVADLVVLAGSRLPLGVVRSLPLAMDRHALTLRCEYREGHCDLRLLFASPAEDATEAGEQVRRLLTAPRCARHHTPADRDHRH